MRDVKLTEQNGSVATFTVVGVILALCVIGGVFMIQQRGQEGSKSEPVAVNTRSASPVPSKSPVASSTPKATPKSSKKPSPAPAKSKAPQSSPSVKPAPSTNEKLPVTGPEDNLASAFMLASLTGVSVAYVRSSRAKDGLRAE